MVSKTVIKLVDEAIAPAVALIIAKMVGLFLASFFLDLPFTISNEGILTVLPSVQFSNLQNYITAENYSNLAMFIFVSLGTIIVITRAHFFHQSHVHPKLQARLARLNLEQLIAPTYHLYHQAAIWLIFLWLTVGFLITSSLIGITYPLLTIIATIVAANFSWIFALDVEKEIEITKLT